MEAGVAVVFTDEELVEEISQVKCTCETAGTTVEGLVRPTVDESIPLLPSHCAAQIYKPRKPSVWWSLQGAEGEIPHDVIEGCDCGLRRNI